MHPLSKLGDSDMFEVNNCFEIGSSHIVCQDYSLSGQIENTHGVFNYGIICDGCSSSRDSDVGARILGMATRRVLINELALIGNVVNLAEANEFGNKIVNEIMKSNDYEFLLKNNSFDSTLLFFICDDEHYRIFAFGDGCVYVDCQGKHVYSIEYAENAPPYLSYRLDKDRLWQYSGRYGNTNKNINIWNFDNSPYVIKNSSISIVESPYLDLFGNIENMNQISLFTDGIFSFEKYNGNLFEKSDFPEHINSYVNYPVKRGEFTVRNFKFNAKNNLKNSIRHFDDLSCASIVRS